MPIPAFIFMEGGSGQTTRRGTPFPSRIVVRVFDDMGAWMPGEEVRFSLPVPLDVPTGRFPSGAFDFSTLTDMDGQARSEVIDADNLPGTWYGVVEVVSAPTVQADFYLTNVEPRGTPASVNITANGTQSSAQFMAYLPVTARLLDSVGAAVLGETITMSCPAGTGTFPGGFESANAGTDANGYATFPAFTASGVTGIFQPQITYPSLAIARADFNTIDPSLAESMAPYSGNNQATPPSFLFTQQLVVRVANGANGPVAGVAVTFDAPASGASLVWAFPFTDPVTRTSDVNGLATAPSAAANPIAGTYTVTITAPGLFPTYFQLTNGGSPPIPDVNALALCEV